MSDWERSVPSVRQQYNLLSRIWGRDMEPGYVFLPWIPKRYAGNDDRKLNFKNGPAFDWPPLDKGAAIKEHIVRHQEDEFYFTPARFYEPERRSDVIAAERALWADLDEVDPRTISPIPTMAWESSPGRFQAVWLFSTSLAGASLPGAENHRLTHLLGADPSGWDSTQLLRVPGTKNNKAAFGEEGAQGYFLYDDTVRPNWEDFRELPEVPKAIVPIEQELFDLLLDRLDAKEILRRVQRKLPRYIRELLRATDTGGNDRSSVAWQIERELADVGCSIEEIVCIVRDSVWNKYHGRADELKRLQIEAQKAVQERVHQNLETLEIAPKEWDEWQSFHEWYRRPTPPMQWLIKDYWIRGGLGFIAGVPKSYKSWFGLNLALAVSSGREFLGVTARQSRVLYIQEEDAESMVKDRMDIVIDSLYPDLHHLGHMILHEAGVVWCPPNEEPKLQVRIQSGFVASDPDWLEKLEEFVTTHHIGMVVIDTLMTVSGDVSIDKAQELRSDILNPLKEMARRLDLAICFVHHNTKGKEESGKGNTRASTRMLGSGQLHAWADCGIYVHDKTDNSIYIQIENKGQADKEVKIVLDQPTADRWLWRPREVPNFKAEEMQEKKETVGTAQKRNGRTPKAYIQLKEMGIINEKRAITLEDMAEKLGYDHLGNLRRLVTTAVKNGYVAQTVNERYYALVR